MYRIFDLCMASNLPLPELEPCQDSGPDIHFFLRDERPAVAVGDTRWLHHWTTPDGDEYCSCGKTGGGFVLRFYGTLDFHISTNQAIITCSPGEDMPLSTVRHLLVDQVVPRLLGSRGSLVVHGSAVMIDGTAVAFVGESGLGKSTLAAFLHRRGHTILTDDCFKLDDDHSTGISITPNYPGVRLFEDSSDALLPSSTRGEMAHYTRKKRIAIGRPADTTHQPLAAIFFLACPSSGKKERVETTPVYGIQRIMKLVQCSFGLYGGAADELVGHFGKQARLANSGIPFLSLSYPRRYDRLPAVRKKILAALRTET